MPDTYGPFDGAQWSEGQWFEHMPAAMPSGVIGAPAASATTGPLAFSSTGLSVTLADGRANVGGGGFKRASGGPSFPVTANSHASFQRRDRLVLRRSLGTHNVAPVVIAGTAASSPVAPAITRNTTVWDLPLFSFLVPPNSGSSITGVVDERVWLDEAIVQQQRIGDEFTGATNASGVATVSHGLGGTPRFVLITQASQASTQSVAKYVVTAKDATTFQVTAYRTDNASLLASNPVHFYWEVVR